MQFIQPPWENYFFSKVHAVEGSLFISSPYIKYPVAGLLYEVLRSKQNPNVSVQILTRVRVQDLIEGASDLEAFEKLLLLADVSGLKVTVKCLSNLHAKVYIFDENSAIVTSSNLTPSGLKSNVEYGIEVTEQGVIRHVLDDMYTYWDDAEILTVEMIEQVAERLEATESVVTVDQLLKQKKKHSLTKTSSISVPRIGKRLIPQGQDVEFAELDNLRKGIITTSKYPKKSKVIITHPEVPSDVEDELDIGDNLTDNETGENIIEIESSYGELEENPVEWLIGELKSNNKKRRKEARIRLEALFFLDDSCILPYIAELASANLKLCCSFLRRSPDSRFAAPHLLHILNTAKAEKGSLPNIVLKTLNDIAPEILFPFLCKAIREPLSTGGKLNAIEWLKNTAVKLNIKEKDTAIEILKSLTENTNSRVCNTAYIALGAVGEIKYLRNAFNQAQRLNIPLNTQMSILKGLIDGGVTPEDELMFVRLTYSHLTRFRVMSVRALCQFEKKYWQRLLDMTKSDPNAEVRIQAIRALVKIDSATAYKVLIKLLEANPEEKVKNTISSLIQKHEESIRELLVDEEQLLQSAILDLQSSDQRVRRKAPRTLGQLKHVSAVQPLCDTLKDEDGIVRAAAAEALGSIGDNASLFSLIEVLENDSYHHARAAAAKALGRCGQVGDKRVLGALLNGHDDRSGRVRKWCFQSLKRLRG